MWRLTSASLPAKESPSSIHLFCLSKANSNGIISFAFSINRDTLLWVPAPQEGADKRLDGLTPNPTHHHLPTSWWIRNQNALVPVFCRQPAQPSSLALNWSRRNGISPNQMWQTNDSSTHHQSVSCVYFITQINGNVHWKCKKKRKTDVRSLIHSDHWPSTLYWANLTSKSTQVNHNWQQCKSKPQFCHSSLNYSARDWRLKQK